MHRGASDALTSSWEIFWLPFSSLFWVIFCVCLVDWLLVGGFLMCVFVLVFCWEFFGFFFVTVNIISSEKHDLFIFCCVLVVILVFIGEDLDGHLINTASCCACISLTGYCRAIVIEQSKRKPMCTHITGQKVHFCLKTWGATPIKSSLQNECTCFHKLRRLKTSTETM